jgi:hypothetical protein
MTPAGTGRRGDHRIQIYRCPLRADPAATCDHPRFPRGGCSKRVNIELGALQRRRLDRSSPTFQALYRHRTTVERCFSRLNGWGLDQLCARRLSTVRTIVLLGCLAINLLVLDHAPPPAPLAGGLAA